jgi:hypothetical protein
MVKNNQRKQYYDVEIIFTDGTSEMLNFVRRKNFDSGTQSHIGDIIFISKEGSEIRIRHDKTILIMDYFALDSRGHKKCTRPNIEYRNFNYVPEMEEEKKLVAKVDEIVQNRFYNISETTE